MQIYTSYYNRTEAQISFSMNNIKGFRLLSLIMKHLQKRTDNFILQVIIANFAGYGFAERPKK